MCVALICDNPSGDPCVVSGGSNQNIVAPAIRVSMASRCWTDCHFHTHLQSHLHGMSATFTVGVQQRLSQNRVRGSFSLFISALSMRPHLSRPVTEIRGPPRSCKCPSFGRRITAVQTRVTWTGARPPGFTKYMGEFSNHKLFRHALCLM